MTTLTDPATIGKDRPARSIKAGWHVVHDGRDALALGNAFVGRYATVNIRYADGQTAGAHWPSDKYVWTRTPAEQLEYIAARHARLLADEHLEKRTLSGAPRPACGRDDCRAQLAIARAEVKRLNSILDSLFGVEKTAVAS